MEPIRRDWGIALSGGGVRAAAFALGGLLYLVDSGLNRLVSVISSVSGASLTNGFLLSRLKDFGSVDSEGFDEVARDLIRRLVLKPVMGKWIVLLNISLVVSGTLVFALCAFGWPVRLQIWLRAGLPIIWGIGFLLRGFPIEFLINRNYLDADERQGRSAALGLPRPLGATAHVFCSTDFVTHSPFFLVDYGCLGCAYTAHGWGLLDHVKIATAIRASAAMPGAFPPRALASAKVKFVDETRSKWATPRWFHLADGGVWDNLGTQWFNRRTGPTQEDWQDVASRCERVPASGPPTHADITKLLVLDARGWGLGFTARQAFWRSVLLRVPFVGEFISLSTTLSILYGNTVEPRVEACMDSLRARMAVGGADDSLLVSVGTLTDYPFDRAGTEAWNVLPQAVRDELHDTNPSGWIAAPIVQQLPAHLQALVDFSAQIALVGEQELATRLPQWLAQQCRDFPPEIGNLWQRCSDIGTKLSALSPWETIALVMHGYVQAMGAASAVIATERGAPGPLPISFPGVDRFDRLLDKLPRIEASARHLQ